MLYFGGGKMLSERIDVRWGDFSQVECELALFKEAACGNYDYYHLLSGVDLPIKSSKYITEFFEKNKGYEFFRIKDNDENRKLTYNNTNYYYLFSRTRRSPIGRAISKLRIPQLSIRIQRLLRVSRCAKDTWTLYKGDNWLSITDAAVHCILNNKNYIRHRFKRTNCPDEIYKQTVLMNCGYSDKVFRAEGRMNSALRSIDWTRGNPYVWTMAEAEELTSSGNLFARKFSTKKDKRIIDYLKNFE